MDAWGLHAADSVCQGDTEKEGQGQLGPVVAVKVHFRQQVAEGNTDERPCGKRQGGGNQVVATVGQHIHTVKKQQCAQRTHQGENHIGGGPRAPAPATGFHHRDNGHGVQRLVQQDGKEYADADQSVRRAIGMHYRAEGDTIDEGMYRQAQRQAHPTQAVDRGFMRMLRLLMRVMVLVLHPLLRTEIMLVKVNNGGNGIPGCGQYQGKRYIGSVCNDFNGCKTAWEFFKRNMKQ